MTEFCQIYQEAVNFKVNHTLGKVCYQGDHYYLYYEESMFALLEGSTLHVANAGYDAALVAQCPFWVNYEQIVPEKSKAIIVETWFGENFCSWAKLFSIVDRKSVV